MHGAYANTATHTHTHTHAKSTQLADARTTHILFRFYAHTDVDTPPSARSCNSDGNNHLIGLMNPISKLGFVSTESREGRSVVCVCLAWRDIPHIVPGAGRRYTVAESRKHTHMHTYKRTPMCKHSEGDRGGSVSVKAWLMVEFGLLISWKTKTSSGSAISPKPTGELR